MNDIYFSKRDDFFYGVIADKQTKRDNKISDILGEDFIEYYYTPDTTKCDNIWDAKFWKDKVAAEKTANWESSIEIRKISRKEFISLIPDSVENPTIRYKKNLKIKLEEVKYELKWSEFRKQYKCIDSYVKVDKPHIWSPCKNCGLIPLIQVYDNCRCTGCGCGEDKYNHFTIRAESINSYSNRNGGSLSGYNSDELRMNWNLWVRNGQNWFEEMKKKNPDIW